MEKFDPNSEANAQFVAEPEETQEQNFAYQEDPANYYGLEFDGVTAAM